MEMDKGLNLIPNYELSTDETNSNIFETSYVFNPATSKSMLYFSNENKQPLEFAKPIVQGWQRITSGVFMMPDTKYIRTDKEGNFYTVSFSKESLYNALVKYLKAGNADNVKIEHNGQLLEGFVAIEHWVIRDENTLSPVLGLSLEDMGYNPQDIPVGTVMKSTYIQDEQFWNDMILSGKVTGYSLGGMFELTEYDFSKQSEQFHSTNITERFKSTYGESFTNGSGVLLTVEDNAVKSNVEGFNGNDCTFYIDGEMLTKCVVKNGKVVEFSDEDDVKVKETAMEAGMIFSKYCVKVEVEIEECENELKDEEQSTEDNMIGYDTDNVIDVSNGGEVYNVDITPKNTIVDDIMSSSYHESFTSQSETKTDENVNLFEDFKLEMLNKMEQLTNNYNNLQTKYDEMVSNVTNVLSQKEEQLMQNETMLQEKELALKSKDKELASIKKEINSQPIRKQQSFSTTKLNEEVKTDNNKNFIIVSGKRIEY